MDEKRSSSRSKRQKPIDEGCWDCSVCTFKNPPEAYKCEMCDVRKGTSTRKPRLNAQIAAQQVAQQYVPPPPKKEKGGPTLRLDSNGLASMNGNESSNDSFDCHMNGVLETNDIVKKEKNHTNASKKNSRSPRLKDIDRSSATHMAVTVGSVTVVITDYKPKKERRTSTETHSNVVSDSSDTSSHGLLHSNDNELVMDNGNQ